MSDFAPHTDAEIAAMLEFLGLGSLDELFSHIPPAIRLNAALDIPRGLAEADTLGAISELGSRNLSATEALICFAGGGAYDHELPSAVRSLAGRSELVTSYTPYQPELAQGVLQALFEYQTMLCALTGMEIANASLYDAASSAVEGCNLAAAATKRKLIWVSRGIHPNIRAVISTFAAGSGLDVREAPLADGVTAWPEGDALGEPAALLVGYPNYLGCLEDVAAASKIAHAAGALLIAAVDPVAAGLLRSVGSLGADVAVGEGQAFGSPMSFGGPYVGLFACKQASYVRRWLPGRLVGETLDAEERRAYVLTLSTREQHIRRADASSNVCTNQTLIAITSAIQMAWLGPQGLRELALRCARGARYTREHLAAIPGVEPVTRAPTLYEFPVRTPIPAAVVLERLAQEGYLGGIALSGDYPELGEAILVTVTERRSRSEIDGFVAAFEKAVQ